VGALVDDDGFGEAILRALTIGAPEKLEKAETAFEDSGSIAESALDGLPKAEPMVGERDGTSTGDEFARRAAVADEVGKAEVEKEKDEIAGLVKIPDDVDMGFVEDFQSPENLTGRPQDDGDNEVEEVAEEALRESRQRSAFELVHARGFVSVKDAPKMRGVCGLGAGGHGGLRVARERRQSAGGAMPTRARRR
jgi:hypothetical protein